MRACEHDTLEYIPSKKVVWNVESRGAPSFGVDSDGSSGTISGAFFHMSQCSCRLAPSSNLFFSLDDRLKTGA
jgi:hypothetical protein